MASLMMSSPMRVVRPRAASASGPARPTIGMRLASPTIGRARTVRILAAAGLPGGSSAAQNLPPPGQTPFTDPTLSGSNIGGGSSTFGTGNIGSNISSSGGVIRERFEKTTTTGTGGGSGLSGGSGFNTGGSGGSGGFSSGGGSGGFSSGGGSGGFSSGGGSGGSGPRPTPTGGSGGSGGSGLPGGFTWSGVLFTMLGIALAIPLWQYVNRRYLLKPEPEHTIAKAKDAAHEVKKGNAVGRAASAVKHATVDPVANAVSAGVNAVRHSDVTRGAQHKAEDAKDNADVAAYETAQAAHRNIAHAGKDLRHFGDDAKASVEDKAAAADNKAHEAKIKGKREAQRKKEQAADAAYDAKVAAKKNGKSVIENVKGAFGAVGRKLHLGADKAQHKVEDAVSTAKRNVYNATHHASGKVHDATTTTDQRAKTAAYVAGGVAAGTAVLATALYLYDRNGGDIQGKVRKLQGKTKDLTDQAVGKARHVVKRGGGSDPASGAAHTGSGPNLPQRP